MYLVQINNCLICYRLYIPLFSHNSLQFTCNCPTCLSQWPAKCAKVYRKNIKVRYPQWAQYKCSSLWDQFNWGSDSWPGSWLSCARLGKTFCQRSEYRPGKHHSMFRTTDSTWKKAYWWCSPCLSLSLVRCFEMSEFMPHRLRFTSGFSEQKVRATRRTPQSGLLQKARNQHNINIMQVNKKNITCIFWCVVLIVGIT